MGRRPVHQSEQQADMALGPSLMSHVYSVFYDSVCLQKVKFSLSDYISDCQNKLIFAKILPGATPRTPLEAAPQAPAVRRAPNKRSASYACLAR